MYEHCYLLPVNDYPLYKVKQYRSLEIEILFLQILAQAIYLLLAKLLIFVRERYCSYDHLVRLESDPFWQHLKAEDQDFLQAENKIML